MATVVGRDRELEVIASFLEHSNGDARVLLLHGDAGIGKTTLWRRAVFDAREQGDRVLACTAAKAEADLSFTGLRDLLSETFDLVAGLLPRPQQRALAAVLLHEEVSGPPPEAGVIAVAVLSTLRALADESPVLVAVDDIQWMDSASADALLYGLRRVGAEQIQFLFSLRRGADSTFDLAEVGQPIEELSVGPLSLGATQRVLLNELGVAYPRPVLRRVVETSGGNPFYALELSRGLERAGGVRSDEPLALSEPLEALIAARLDSVSEDSARLLSILSLLPSATTRVLDALHVMDGLDEVVAAGLVEIDGDVARFAHPLLAAGAQARLGRQERRELHAALSSALEDPVERARHLARATLVASTDTGEELARAAAVAAARGLPTIAAELAEEAVRLTPESEPHRSVERRRLAATFHAVAGSDQRARELLDEVIPKLRGDDRADALRLLAQVTSDITIQKALLRRALEESDDPSVGAEINALLVRNHLYFGDLDAALASARAADELAQQTGDPRRITAAMTTRGLMEIWGRGAPDPDVYQRARELADAGGDLPTDTYSNPHTLLGARALYRYEVEEARSRYAVGVAAAEAAGDVDSLETFWWGLAQVEVRAGRYEAAAAYVEKLQGNTETYDRRRGSLLWIEGVLDTYRGRVEEARSALDETIARAEAATNWFFVVYGRSALGFLELSTGDAQAAVDVIDPILSAPLVVEGDPGQTGILPIAAEALLATGDVDRASALVARLEERGRQLEHAWCLATAGRSHGQLLAAQGDFDAAFDEFENALSFNDRLPVPFERARTLLALGSTQRRARKRRAARESLTAALSAFEELGTPLWAKQARAELGRIGGRPPSSGALTPTEQQIAELVASGKTNKEVAALLVVADRTVESALTQIYRKLDVRSRTELARKLSDQA